MAKTRKSKKKKKKTRKPTHKSNRKAYPKQLLDLNLSHQIFKLYNHSLKYCKNDYEVHVHFLIIL